MNFTCNLSFICGITEIIQFIFHKSYIHMLLLFSRSLMSDSLWPHGLQHARLPVLHYLLEFAQTHVHWVSDAIQSSHPLSPLLLLPSFACISFLPELLETLHKISSIFFNLLLDTCASHQHISLMNKKGRKKKLSVALSFSFLLCCFFQCSVQFSHSVLSNSLRPHGLQHARLPCPSPTSRAYSNSCQ